MSRVASEDSVRRGLERIDAETGASWLQGHLDDTVRPLLSEPWVFDCDTTIKPLTATRRVRLWATTRRSPAAPRMPAMRS